MRRAPRQFELRYRTWGGSRKGAGRPRTSRNTPHRRRPTIGRSHPIHLTLRLSRLLPSLRTRLCLALLWRAFRRTRGLRIVHFSVQKDHLHLLVEVVDGGARGLTNGVRSLCTLVARQLNRWLRRKGNVFSDRYHAHVLRTPREVRNALVYVIHNYKRHRAPTPEGLGFDPFSSAPYFPGWAEGPVSWPKPPTGPPPVAAPQSYLLAQSWKALAPIRLSEAPSPRG